MYFYPSWGLPYFKSVYGEQSIFRHVLEMYDCVGHQTLVTGHKFDTVSRQLNQNSNGVGYDDMLLFFTHHQRFIDCLRHIIPYELDIGYAHGMSCPFNQIGTIGEN